MKPVPIQTRIIETANRLIYIKGYNQTSFADIADELGISKGNLQYHFRNKDALLDAIVDHRKSMISEMLQQWDSMYGEPKEKLHRFVRMVLSEESDLIRFGCPMGSLNAELGKGQIPLRDKAREMFDLFLIWLEKVFAQLNRQNKKNQALHLLTMAQGAALMAYVYADRNLLSNELDKISQWIDTL